MLIKSRERAVAAIKEFGRHVIKQTLLYLPANVKQYVSQILESECLYAPPAVKARIDALLEQAGAFEAAKEYDEAELRLKEAIRLFPGGIMLAPHLSRINFLKSRSVRPETIAQERDMTEGLGAMKAELQRNELYVPGTFWETHGNFHVELLRRYGVENFKRTVSHHYQNWLMVSLTDSQVKHLLRTWTQHFSLQPWVNSMETPDHVGMHLDLDFKQSVYPLAYPNAREIYKIAVGLLWEYVLHTDRHNLLNNMTESELGNPLRIQRAGRLISSDLAHSVRERNLLIDELSLDAHGALVVGELGAGHGRLAEVFGKSTNYRYFIFDITPALYVSQWYVERLFPREKIFRFRSFDKFEDIKAELDECRFAFFTANQIELLPASLVDLFINMNSLMEMQKRQIVNFLNQIARVTKLAFLSRQWKQWVNPLEFHAVDESNYTMPAGWQLLTNKTDEIFPRFFNHIWVRQRR